ncbi:MAG: hypothetical protein ABSD31_04045 [Candidatus Binataceae bacterium]|jgi:hypothetical protein
MMMLESGGGQTTSRVASLASPPPFDIVITAFLALAGWHFGLARISDNSFFCHLATGRWILDHGIPRTDPFSFTAAGTPWVAESWMADLIYGALDRWFGPAALTTLNAATGAAIAALWYRIALRLARDRVYAFLITMLSLGASFTMWSHRPLLLGILAFLVLVWIVEIPDSATGRNPLLAIPPLIWIWANVHGSFTLAFVYLGLHCAGRWLDGAPPWSGRERRLIEAAVVGFALCFVNPYGVRLLIAPIHLLSHHVVLSNVAEWRPPAARSLQGAIYTLWVLIFVTAAIRGSTRITLRGFVVSVPFLIMGLWAERNIAIAPIASFPVVASAFVTPHDRADRGLPLNWVAIALALALGGLWTIRAWANPALDFHEYPAAAMDAVEAQGLLGRRLLTTDSWGDYVVLRYGPRQRIFMDDRYDLYPPAVAADLESLLIRQGDWPALVRKYDIDVVVWPRRDPSVNAIVREFGFKPRYEDEIAVVLARGLVSHASGDEGQR